jgi:hypothetical protein
VQEVIWVKSDATAQLQGAAQSIELGLERGGGNADQARSELAGMGSPIRVVVAAIG